MNRTYVIGVRNKPIVASGRRLVGSPTGRRRVFGCLLEMSFFDGFQGTLLCFLSCRGGDSPVKIFHAEGRQL